MGENVRAHVIIMGRVQGVAFRADTRWAARRMQVSGWVRNRRDGSVEAVIEGEKDRVEKMLEWCRRGPELAQVDDMKIQWEPFTGEFTSFSITF